MDDSWTGLALPFGMIGLWVLFGVLEIFRTPDHTKDPSYRKDRNLEALGTYRRMPG